MSYIENERLLNMSSLLHFLYINDRGDLIKYVERHSYLVKSIIGGESMNHIMTALASLASLVVTSLTSLAGLWVVAIPAAMFVIGLAVKFLFGLMGRGKRKKGR